MKILFPYLFLLSILLFTSCGSSHQQAEQGPRKIEILFLGHHSEHHNSEKFMPMLASALATEGINFTYTEDPEDLNNETLSHYDGLMIYANHEEITSAQEEALLDFVAGGKGFIPVHSASFCFLNSPKYIDLVGGQFKSHETGTFTAKIVKPDHPAMLGVEEFSTWDETYVHSKLSDDRTVLMERVEGNHREPWTWVKQHGEGRVFYTAYGHDERTWSNPGFHNLMEAAITWAVGDGVREQWQAYMRDMPDLQYEDREGIPNYEKRDPAPRYQLPLSPEKSAKLIQVPVGFKLELFASEPDIINPIAMDWDEKGRLWVIETVDYPNTVRNEDGVGDDRIKICEDTDGDGKADKFTIFADKLNIPTSLAFANGGIVVSQAPHFLFLKDTNGDDKADIREEIISGWGTFDTHAGPSNLKYGLDNHIWGVLGYSGFKGDIAGKNFDFRQGVYKFKLDQPYKVTDFEYLTHTSNNTWGLGFTEDFDVFASTANNTHSVYMGIPNRYLENIDGLPKEGSEKIDGHYGMMPIGQHLRQVDVWGGFTAASGHNFYTARQFPSEYWNKMAMVCEPTGHVVHLAEIEPEGAGFKELNAGNLFAGADEWVAPVEAKVGPDGAVWVADWYNFIIQHNPTPTPDRGGYEAETGEGNAYVNPLRDRQHGRIWRVIYDGKSEHQELSEPLQLSIDDPDQLIEALGSDNMFWRTTAQRLLVERGETDIASGLYKMIKKGSTDEIGNSPAAIHALWTLHGLGLLDGTDEEAYKVVTQALSHPSAGVRKAAVEVLPRTPWANQAISHAKLLQDENPRTRLTAILSTAEMENSDGLGRKLYSLSQQENIKDDPWLSSATYVAGVHHSQSFMDEFKKSHPDFTPVQTTAATEEEKEDNDKELPLFDETRTIGAVLVQNYWNKKPEKPVTDEAVDEDVTTIHIKTIKNAMKYDVSEFVVEAGKKVKVVFENPDFMQHNLLILQMGSLEKVGAAADKLATDPKGAEKSYVPDMEEVLFNTPLIDPESKVEITFTAPENPGEYPFVCTFPGHWRIMQGTMKVVPSEAI